MNKPKKKPIRFVAIPIEIINSRELSDTDFRIYSLLLSYYPRIFISKRTIAKKLNYDVRTVRRAIKNLETIGLVKEIKRVRASSLYIMENINGEDNYEIMKELNQNSNIKTVFEADKLIN